MPSSAWKIFIKLFLPTLQGFLYTAALFPLSAITSMADDDEALSPQRGTLATPPGSGAVKSYNTP